MSNVFGVSLKPEVRNQRKIWKRLETLDYITRGRDPADERQVRARLTEKGRRLRAKALHIPGCILAASGLDAGTAKQMMTGIATLRRALEKYNPK